MKRVYTEFVFGLKDEPFADFQTDSFSRSCIENVAGDYEPFLGQKDADTNKFLTQDQAVRFVATGELP